MSVEQLRTFSWMWTVCCRYEIANKCCVCFHRKYAFQIEYEHLRQRLFCCCHNHVGHGLKMALKLPFIWQAQNRQPAKIISAEQTFTYTFGYKLRRPWELCKIAVDYKLFYARQNNFFACFLYLSVLLNIFVLHFEFLHTIQFCEPKVAWFESCCQNNHGCHFLHMFGHRYVRLRIRHFAEDFRTTDIATQ